MATNTEKNIGYRRDIGTLGPRNFENTGTVQYKVVRSKLDFLNDEYYFDDVLPFDNEDDTYSLAAIAQLQLYWDQGWLAPVE